MIVGTIIMSLLAGVLFGVVKGIFMVIFNAKAGTSFRYFLFNQFGRPIVMSPEKLNFQDR